MSNDGDNDDEASNPSVNTDLLYRELSSALLGIRRSRLLCLTGRFKGEPLFAVLVRRVLEHCILTQKLELTPQFLPLMHGHLLSGIGDTEPGRCFWPQTYDAVGVAHGAIGCEDSRVKVLDKAGHECGTEAIKLVVRKALCRDVGRAFCCVMVHLKHWSLSKSDASVRMQPILSANRRSGMVQYLAELFVENFSTTVDTLLTPHLAKFRLFPSIENFDLLQNVVCTVPQATSKRPAKRPRGAMDELSNLYLDVQDLLPDPQKPERFRFAAVLKLQVHVKRFLEKARKPSVQKRITETPRGGMLLKTLEEFSAAADPPNTALTNAAPDGTSALSTLAQHALHSGR